MVTHEPHPAIPGLEYQRDLGSGGFADVYLYHRQTPDRLVAIKVLRPTSISDKLIERFTAEANAMAALTHPHIAQVYAAGLTSDGRPYIEMAYYPNGTLDNQVRKSPLAVQDVLRIGVQLCSAIETAHQLNPPLLHRDIKPANVLIDEYNDPALTDFGIASRITDQDDHKDVRLSVYWAAPEVMFATAPVSTRSDIYSLGALLWHLLAGHPPFVIPGGDNQTNTTMLRTRDLPVPPTGFQDVPKALERLLTATMSKNPRFRPSSAAELARALQAIEQQEYGFARVTPFKIKTSSAGQPAVDTPPPASSPKVTTQPQPNQSFISPFVPNSAAPLIDPEAVATTPPAPLGQQWTQSLAGEFSVNANDATTHRPRPLTPYQAATPQPATSDWQEQPYAARPSAQPTDRPNARIITPSGPTFELPSPMPSDSTGLPGTMSQLSPNLQMMQTPAQPSQRSSKLWAIAALAVGLAVIMIAALVYLHPWSQSPTADPSTIHPPAVTVTRTVTPTPGLQIGSCLTVPPGDLMVGPPPDWQTMTADCSSSTASTRIVSINSDCETNKGCATFTSSGISYQIYALPVPGVCFPGYTAGDGAYGWAAEWSRCDNFKRDPAVDTAASKQQAAQDLKVSVADLKPATIRIETITHNENDCTATQWTWLNAWLDGKTYVLCTDRAQP